MKKIASGLFAALLCLSAVNVAFAQATPATPANGAAGGGAGAGAGGAAVGGITTGAIVAGVAIAAVVAVAVAGGDNNNTGTTSSGSK